ncbi:Cell division cycle cdt2 [Hyphodiscus hymeniophilus]|uniref:Cell division cycle cdt2 n=1 Tax=Hyphodiscus hymeniophilus TaxID=353542 RepID=A0A9P7AX94_9HELO|nr:Cell division cycle cdt2 [Hyphodiscus hymeniophilus]
MSEFASTEKKEPQSSQELPLSNPPSSSPQAPPPDYGQSGRKERRQPSITPKKFSRFFTPRSLLPKGPARQILNDITSPSNNRRGVLSSPIQFNGRVDRDDNPSTFPRGLKRRKLLHTPEEISEHILAGSKAQEEYERLQDENVDDDLQNLQSSPCERAANLDRVEEEEEVEGMELESEMEEKYSRPLQRIIPIDHRGHGGSLLQSMSGLPTRSRRQHHAYPVNDWQDETASFYSRPEDVHMSTGLLDPHRVIPFCALPANSLVAIADEEGRVRLLESAENERESFSQVYLGFRVHTNAIIDMVFSKDDTLLATASGDQSARVVDMKTQTTIAVLDNHSASLKQVRFQPGSGSDSVLATSARDGTVQIWDLRCKGNTGPKQSWNAALRDLPVTRSGTPPTYGRPIYSIFDAHRQVDRNALNPLPAHAPVSDMPGRGEVAGRFGDVSVTAISFLPEGNEHLLLTASEADTSVMLWDMRCLHSKAKRKTQVAISKTRQPDSHNQWRHFGVNSINLSGDGSRLYALSKDNTVYAYSTSHLILGHAPELSLDNPGRRLPPQETREGLGPMYGFRHPKLHATSFYVKSALRPARNGRSEMLAVGSSDGCAILFPTDERYLPQHQDDDEQNAYMPSSAPLSSRRPALRRTAGSFGIGSRVEETMPISTHGTPLIRGHDREVGSLAWTADGELVTVGDDFFVRCWRESGDARDLRTGGEGEGRRWGCGWADVSEAYDEDDG